MPPTPRPRVLFISLNRASMFESDFENLVTKISHHSTIHRVFLPIAAIRLLASNFAAVFLTDEALTQTKYTLVWEAVIEYLQAGGKVICLGCFGTQATQAGMARFFSKVHFRWTKDERHTAPVYVNAESLSRAIRRRVPAAYETDAVYLGGVGVCDSWYRSAEEDITSEVVDAGNSGINPWTYSAAAAKVGSGFLGLSGIRILRRGLSMLCWLWLS
ncbi:hypothetical protein N7478_008341 [Penicillium angulare]|uniref:uncharacterized protein n=1 Tax=Penicillium angulare TaxID=116970 RepID=UPI002540D99E|nr:uncharacterized protein N7478_008341 [Penicillium angulare]KAJ5273216.1 hypothetical protein N7478_008341 [Penicillium angulare]